MKALVGLVPVESGTVRLFGQDITGLPAHRLVREGLAFVPQTENVFARLSVRENLELGAAIFRPGSGAAASRPSTPSSPTSRACGPSRPDACRAASGRCSRWRARSSSSLAS